MGKRSKKLKTQAGEGHRSIGELFHKRPKPKMAAPPESQDSPKQPNPHPHTITGDRGAPATKGDIMDLMVHLRAFFRADLPLVQEEVTAVTEQIRATEEDITSLTQTQAGTSEQVCQIHSLLEDVQRRLNVMGAARRRKNLKVRGVGITSGAYLRPYYHINTLNKR
ncbi:Hypothetical predicted protein [Pelobates cultripes]|uniref:Uncharacterized protein n=1 Tax=Pelobates cultripes TaxID=61616 RepID=A0AAD1VYN3_PELCU|nr:Hypothetical predicted protein [Pelobates cultripes]